MLTKGTRQRREQVQMVSIGDLVPRDHLLRDVDRAINFDFSFDIAGDLYCPDNGRPSIDPVVLFKIVFIQYLHGIRSMRHTTRSRSRTTMMTIRRRPRGM